jgi:hypothetical protein
MAKPRGSDGWRSIKDAVHDKPAPELVHLLRDLYELSPANRQFLHARFGSRSRELDQYRASIQSALCPDPLSRHPDPSLVTGKRLIREYERATRDDSGAVDLMLAFVEAGASFAVDLGYGDDAFFSSLSAMLERALDRANVLSPELRASLVPRLTSLRRTAGGLGWGFGDFVTHAVDVHLASSSPALQACGPTSR